MTAMLLLVATAHAGEPQARGHAIDAVVWAPPARRDRVELPGGEELIVETLATVELEGGGHVETVAHPLGQRVLAAPTSRVLHLPRRTRVRTESGRGGAAELDWMEHRARTDASELLCMDVPDLCLVSLAVADEATVDLERRAALEQAASRTQTTHLRRDLGLVGPLAAGESVVFDVVGPGSVVVPVRVQSLDGGLVRTQVSLRLRERVEVQEIASTGEVPVLQRVWVPPGEHALEVHAGAAMWVGAVEWRQRGHLGRPVGPAPRAGTPAEAEWAWLHGARRPDDWRSWIEDEGPVGDLARARLLVCLGDGEAELRRRLALRAPATSWGAQVMARAVLEGPSLGAGLTTEVVVRAGSVPAASLALWLEGWPASRPRGTGLLRWLEAQEPGIASERLRVQSLSTRFRSLEPDAPMDTVIIEQGPGAERRRLGPGAVAQLDLAAPANPSRSPVLRLEGQSVVATVDGRPLTGSGSWALGVTPGHHQVEVESGELWLLDPETVLQGGTPAYAWKTAALPARWEVPDPGVPVELRVMVEEPVQARWSTGARESWTPDTRGLATVWVPSNASWVEVEGTGRVGLAMRTPLRARGVPDPVDAEDLETLRELTVRVDAGDDAARLDRARVLAGAGWLSRARADLEVLVARGEHQARARSLSRSLAPSVPSAPHLGPASIETALALDPNLPLDSLFDALAAHPEASFRRLGAIALADEGRLVEAVAVALTIGDDLAQDLLRGWSWSPTRANRGAELVESSDELPSEESHFEVLREALVAAPFTGRGLRDGWAERLRPDGPVTLQAFCRDETLLQRPCRPTVVADGRRVAFDLADGEATEVALDARLIDVLGPGSGRVVVLRWLRDGALIDVESSRLVEGVAREAQYTVAGGAVVRLEVLSGQGSVRWTDARGDHERPLMAGGAHLLAAVGEGPVDLLVAGPLELRASVAVPAASADRLPPQGLEAPALPEGGDVRPYLDLVEARGRQEIYVGAGPTVGGEVAAVRDYLPALGTPWEVMEARLGLGWRSRPWLGSAQVWGRSRGAAGANAWAGWSSGGWVGALGADVAAASDGSSHGYGRGRASGVWQVLPTHEARLTLLGRVGVVNLASPRTDPRVASLYTVDHPHALMVIPRWRWEPVRNARLGAGLAALSNAAVSLDRVGAFVEADWLIAQRTLLSVETAAWRRLPDADRQQASTRVDLRVDGVTSVVHTRSRRIDLYGWGRWTGWLEAGIGLRAWLSSARGGRDFMPWEQAFPALREPVEGP